MTELPPCADELRALADMACDDALTAHHVARLEELLYGDVAAQEFYLAQLCFDRRLRWALTHPIQESPALSASQPLLLLSTSLNNRLGYFSSGWPVAYLAATVMFGIGLAIASMTTVSHPAPLARTGLQSPSVPSPSDATEAEHVGRITGVADCVWEGSGFQVQGLEGAQQKSGDRNRRSVLRLGDRLALSSGLMEITYDTGAKVILQGPATYEVESKNGGYLSVGKLTARLEKESEVGGQRPEAANQKSEITNHQFSIRTPTALVTDLGTEFGVEVLASGVTESHVFRGRVEVRRRAPQGQAAETIVLKASEAVRIERDSIPAFRLAANPAQFITAIPKTLCAGLIARYKLDEITGGLVDRTPDASGQHRSGSLWNMTRANLVPGKAGRAMAFNVANDAAVERITLPWSPAFDLAGDSFTIAVWLNRREAGKQIHETILHKEGGGSPPNTGGYSIMRERDSGRLMFRVRDVNDAATIVRTNTSGDDAPIGEWVHFAVVGSYDRVGNRYEITLYRNGIECGKQDRVAMAELPLPLSLGGVENGWGFRGLLYDVQMHRRVLNGREVKFLADHPGELPPAPASDDSQPNTKP